MEVLSQGSIGRGAEAIGLSAAQASRTLSRLEHELGLSLLVRSRSGVSPTAEGALLAERMRPLIARIDQIEHSLKQSVDTAATLVVPFTPAAVLFPKWLGELKGLHPEIHIALRTPKHELLPVTDPPSDFRISLRRFPENEREIAIRICGVPLVLAASPDYLSDTGDVLEPESLVRHRLVMAPSETETPLVLRRASALFRVDVSQASIFDSLIAVKNSVLSGSGIALSMPLYLIEEELDRGDLVRILPDWRMEPVSLWFMRPPSRFPSLVAQKLVAWFKTCAARTPGLLFNGSGKVFAPGKASEEP